MEKQNQTMAKTGDENPVNRTSTKIEERTEKFFKRRFPEKDIAFEKKCGYFYEWMTRFNSGNPEGYMDTESLAVWRQMQEEGY